MPGNWHRGSLDIRDLCKCESPGIDHYRNNEWPDFLPASIFSDKREGLIVLAGGGTLALFEKSNSWDLR